jgi:thioredoxin reductase (NADPH)
MSFSLSVEDPKVFDVVIVGGGPAGASAALYAARSGLSTVVVDKGLTAGALGMAARIANYPGVPGEISGAELVSRMRDQAASFGAEFVNEKVLQVDLQSDSKRVWAGGREFRARAVIIATGAMGRTDMLPNEEPLIGRGVSYCATCDAAFFRGHDVAVVGNNDEAVDEALTLARFASHVHFLSPTSRLRAAPGAVESLQALENAAFYPGARVLEIVGDGSVEGVRFTAGREERLLPIAGIFIYLQGNTPVTDFLQGQVPTGEGGCVSVGEDYQTGVPGVFAAGDVLCGHLRQVAVSTAEGVAAATAVDRYLHGREDLRPDWQ